MAELKTKETDADVNEFIDSFANTEQKKLDSYELVKLMEKVSGHKPRMWGPSIIGFGKYHYKSDRSSQEGDWPLIGFSPRKAALTLYVCMYEGSEEQDELLSKLGKFKKGGGCLYVKKLSDIDTKVLTKIMKATINFLKKKYPGK